jgi:hypothetical protein
MRMSLAGIAVLSLFATSALAQTTPMPAPPNKLVTYPDGKAYPQAPIGHRQPSLSNLPPDLARRERLDEPPIAETPEGGNPRDTNIDPQLRICRGC